jgi:hypothetical protein
VHVDDQILIPDARELRIDGRDECAIRFARRALGARAAEDLYGFHCADARLVHAASLIRRQEVVPRPSRFAQANVREAERDAFCRVVSEVLGAGHGSARRGEEDGHVRRVQFRRQRTREGEAGVLDDRGRGRQCAARSHTRGKQRQGDQRCRQPVGDHELKLLHGHRAMIRLESRQVRDHGTVL